ncbi:hypothetical protein J4E91_003515 [Alternaria rosae]|nr:hypothetical protein J4E91_003515 [Alternaria rosae]
MKYLITTLAATAALLSAVTADFEIYRVGIGGNGITANVEGWQVYQDEANCDTVNGGDLVDTNDVPVGKCYPFPAAFLECGLTVSRLEGYRKLRCDGIDVSAEQINSNRFSLRGRSLSRRNQVRFVPIENMVQHLGFSAA